MFLPAITTTTIILAAIAFVLAHKGPNWYLHFQFARAFRAGRKFYKSYPHIAKDIRYGARPRQTLDVYWPPDRTGALRRGDRLPVVLFVYGGSWSWGDKSLYQVAGARFTERGCVAVIVNYTLYPDVTFPTFVEDVAAAIAWTVRHIAAYHGDPERLFVTGHSAGAHILSLIALDDRYLAAHGLPRDVLRGVIAISAPTDLTTLLRHLEAHSPAAPASLQAIMGGPDVLPRADPIRHARADAPPILLLHGARDRLVPVSVARNFASALQAAGAPVELREYDRADHYSIVLDAVRDKPRRPAPVLVETVRFIQGAGAASGAGAANRHAEPPRRSRRRRLEQHRQRFWRKIGNRARRA